MKTYHYWLKKLRKRAQPSGTLSQWAELLSQKNEGSAELWREYLQAILDEEERPSLDLILDLDHIAAPAKEESSNDEQISLW
ncbi:hypothetical protein GYB43_06395 [bacterium]|jgi:hypothetical protein|nr:hypothetical protein [bacterium]